MQQQTERDLAFSQQRNRQNYKAAQKRSDDNINRRPKRLVESSGPAATGHLALTSGKTLSQELSDIVKQGGVGSLTKYVVCPFYSLSLSPVFALRSEKTRRLSIDTRE